MNESALVIVQIFFAKKKKDVKKICQVAVIDEKTLSQFINLCDSGLLPWHHHIATSDWYQENVDWTTEDYKKSKVAGSDGATRSLAKLDHLMSVRRLLVGHLFYLPDHTNWHFLYFDNRDLMNEQNHFQGGQHIHLINHLSWPNRSPEDVLEIFRHEKPKFNGSFHIRFDRHKPSWYA